eukprot:CAMPEP_0205869594 /NCGR_PEP_ID=MMETSP1083-20121108/10096_1 /ASSEMBLY_ACC=CAM_ASM_000430 /TAXON_ID=97485 /ORGANISM="Prymnesium parvum, Strain Texoma1" /LENGTH=122 /DNA_ID=CAMNT_0053231795 /DNA_START=442 /DNA_END=808 /DNA_ORIENTATION=-
MEPFSDTPIVVQNPTTKQSCTWSELFLAALGALGELVDVLASLLALARDGLRDTLAHAALVALAKLPVVRAALGQVPDSDSIAEPADCFMVDASPGMRFGGAPPSGERHLGHSGFPCASSHE